MVTAKPRKSPDRAPGCSIWNADHLALIATGSVPEADIIGAADAAPVIPGLTLWDIWPVQLENGDVAPVAGGTLWIVLSAPRRADPDQRHDEARMRLLHRVGDNWHDCGNLLPDELAPGSREWSGAARLDAATGIVTVWFTAAGRRGSVAKDFEQRLFQVSGRLDFSGLRPAISDWHGLIQPVINDGVYYADLAVNQGQPGRIKGFRDPYWFRDPSDGREYILFTGSKSAATSTSDYDGVIGIAVANEADAADADMPAYILLPPIIDADGAANELERPHIFVRDGLYYLFWSSQTHIFAPGVPVCPTGLYGMVSPSLFGPYQPMNGSGLVLANPASEPRQAYAWQVVPSLDIVSFVDYWGLHGRNVANDTELKSAQFGGTIAPTLKIALDGASSWIVEGQV
jgi:levansucrase